MVNQEAVQKAKAAIKRSADFDYFFDNLISPAWIMPLFQEGFFDNPYPPIRDEQYIRFPIWPASRYLVRMAELSPNEVAHVALRISDTSNVRVWEDLAEIAFKLPPPLAAKFVPLAERWFQSPIQLLLPEKMGQLVSHLAKGGQFPAALQLAKWLIVVLPDPKSEEAGTEEEKKYRLSPTPRSQFEEWEYQRILTRNIPDLIAASWKESFTWLCDLLEQAIAFSRYSKDDTGPEDYSYIWRRAIEDHEQNVHHGVKELLVTAVRDSGQQVAVLHPQCVGEVISILEARPWKVFHRLALHLMRQHPDAVLDVITARLTDYDQFEEAVHEYRLLLQAMWTRIGIEAQNMILGWIEAGPTDIEERSSWWEKEKGERPSPEQEQNYKKTWQLKKLALIHKDLNQTWQDYYQALLREVGEPEHPEFSSYTVTWRGPTSPKDKQELQSLSVTALRSFLDTWRPGKDWRGFAPTPEGLGRTLTTLISEEPSRYAESALEFRGLDPTYVRSILDGFVQALGHNRSFLWQPVLDLCGWVIEQPISLPGRVISDRDADPDWGWTRKSIARLLSSGFNHDTLMPQFNLREILWGILEPLTKDPDPTPEDEAENEGNKWEPTTLPINTTRGNALHALIRYAVWVQECLDKSAGEALPNNHSFQAMPEVRQVLDYHLDPANDPSAAIRSIYGQSLSNLHWLDPSWVASNIKTIFPPDAVGFRLHLAAWDAFIGFTNPYKKLYQLLKDEYRAAVERIGADLPEQQLSADRDERLAEHLMALYWWGELSIEEHQGLMARFYEKASPELSAHAMDFLGRCLRDNNELPIEAIDRLKAFWIWRYTQITTTGKSKHHARELSEFGGWFASGHLDLDWSISQLLDVLKRTGKAEPDHLVIERLVSIREAMPGKVIECLRLLIEGDKEGWLLLGEQEHVREILSAGVASSDQHVREAATELINWLAARGNREFLSLLFKHSGQNHAGL
ncbi:MAG: hypothetical protein P0111_03905 [Nitrospira sp.]|nr:hypothetical protein [Nitrospira sp.]